MVSYASIRRSYIADVRREFTTKLLKAIHSKMRSGLNSVHIDCLLLYHAGLPVNPHVFEELCVAGVIRANEERGVNIAYN